jgi:hypothetical protein
LRSLRQVIRAHEETRGLKALLRHEPRFFSGKQHMVERSLDSTQTVRALSATELQDPGQRKWFVVQLVTSQKPINLDMMPRLEIFASHRLYVVETRSGGTSSYGLRLGFFDDEVAVNATCGYLKTFFGSPGVVRVSAAEHARFAQSAPAVAAAKVPQPVPREAPRRESPAARPAVATAALSTKPTGSSQPRGSRSKTLGEELVEEARQLQRSRNSKQRANEAPQSWLSRLLSSGKA